jgi:hypothetical protein
VRPNLRDKGLDNNMPDNSKGETMSRGWKIEVEN